MRAAFLGVIGLVATAGVIQAQTYANFGEARLKDLVEQALENNPGIRRAFGEYEPALQRIPQLTSLPDPMVGVTQYVRSPETRVGPQNTMLSISQAGERRNLAEITRGVYEAHRSAACWKKSGERRNNPDGLFLPACDSRE